MKCENVRFVGLSNLRLRAPTSGASNYVHCAVYGTTQSFQVLLHTHDHTEIHHCKQKVHQLSPHMFCIRPEPSPESRQ